MTPFSEVLSDLWTAAREPPLDDYLIDRARWQRDKQQLIERAGLEAFVDPRKVLDELDEASHRQYLITNGNIAGGKNPHIKFGKKGGFTLATPKQEESDAEPLQHFFPERSYVPLLEVLSTVNRYTHYVDELQHWQQRYHHRRPSEPTVFAGVIGIGCMIGLRKMMRISHPINESELEHTVNWHFSVDGLQAVISQMTSYRTRSESNPQNSRTSLDSSACAAGVPVARRLLKYWPFCRC